MDVIGTLRQQVQEGRIGAGRLIDLMASQQRQFPRAQQQLQATQQQLEAVLQHLQAARQRIEKPEKKHGVLPPAAKLDQAFSMRAEEQRQQAHRLLHPAPRAFRKDSLCRLANACTPDRSKLFGSHGQRPWF
jgi:small-conductance mechanosensitive channel